MKTPHRLPPTHVPALDGLRGIAILSVLLFHLSWVLSPTHTTTHAAREVVLAGWVGVDLFFVLSGYLVTFGLTSYRLTSDVVPCFLARRALRILPLYYAVLLVGTLLTRQTDVWHWVYLQNYSLPFAGDPRGYTAHFWSLAVEEQFYILWPFVLVAFGPLTPRDKVLAVLGLWAGVVLVRAGLVIGLPRVMDGYDVAKLVYRATPTRLDGLLSGAAVAIAHREGGAALALLRRARVPLGLFVTLGLLVLASTVGVRHEDRRFEVVGYPLLAAGFALVLTAVLDDALPRWLLAPLRGRFLGYVGTRSYGIYVFHWPLIAWAAPRLDAAHAVTSEAEAWGLAIGAAAGLVLATVLAAEASFRWLEKPILSLKDRIRRTPRCAAPIDS
ncbi:MAG: acyltransferase [Polyangiaceae bacterium]